MLKLISACRLHKDPVLSEILRYLIFRGPSTAYRIARDLNLHFTQAYRKASRLEHFGLVRRINNHRGDMFEVTERGLILCYYYGCLNWETILDKLAARQKLPRLVIRTFLDEYLTYFKEEALIDDLLVMAFYAIYRGMPVPSELISAVEKRLLKPLISH